MNEAQIVAALLQFYKQQGVDMHYVLDDPVFSKLPLVTKIEAIKKHAAEIVAGTSPGLGRAETGALLTRALRLGVQGALTGAAVGAGMSASTAFMTAKKGAGFGAVTGLVAGLGSGALGAYQQFADKRAIRDQLEATAKNPTDSNVLGALSIGAINQRRVISRDEILDAVRGATESAVSPDRIGQVLQFNAYHTEAAQR